MGRGKELLLVMFGAPAALLALAALLAPAGKPGGHPAAIEAPPVRSRLPDAPVTRLAAGPAQPTVAGTFALQWSAEKPQSDAIPSAPLWPHQFSVLPKNMDHSPKQWIAEADAILTSVEDWKAGNRSEPPSYSDFHAARVNLTGIKPGSPEFESGKLRATRMDGLGKDVGAYEIAHAEALTARAVENDVAGRKAYAGAMETRLLRGGMDAVVRAEGRKATTLRLRYVLMSRPLLFKIAEDGGMFREAKASGFRTIVFTDGYRSEWTYDLVQGRFR